ncbi:MAG: hypothetical protein ACLRHW_18465 [Coprobacillus cateniformis]
MTETKYLFFDIDGTLAEWRSSVTEKDLSTKGYFSSLNPTELISIVPDLSMQKGFELFVLSSYKPEDIYACSDKELWCNKHVPLIKPLHRLFVPHIMSKSEYVKSIFGKQLDKNMILVDDYTLNLNAWANAGGKAIKWLNGLNGTKGTWKGEKVELKNYIRYWILHMDERKNI